MYWLLQIFSRLIALPSALKTHSSISAWLMKKVNRGQSKSVADPQEVGRL